MTAEPDKKTDSTLASVDKEMVQRFGEIRVKVQSAFGQVVLAMSALPRYRHQSLADLGHLVIDPLARDRIAIAAPAAGPEKGAEAATLAAPAIAIWASVSEAVGKKIEEQIKGGAFPVRLKPEEWNSGDQVWLLDVIAPSQKLATAVLASFRQVAKQDQVRIHPLISKLVDPTVLDKLRRAPGTSLDATGDPVGSLN